MPDEIELTPEQEKALEQAWEKLQQRRRERVLQQKQQQAVATGTDDTDASTQPA